MVFSLLKFKMRSILPTIGKGVLMSDLLSNPISIKTYNFSSSYFTSRPVRYFESNHSIKLEYASFK